MEAFTLDLYDADVFIRRDLSGGWVSLTMPFFRVYLNWRNC